VSIHRLYDSLQKKALEDALPEEIEFVFHDSLQPSAAVYLSQVTVFDEGVSAMASTIRL
jgi:hypothetical protein